MTSSKWRRREKERALAEQQGRCAYCTQKIEIDTDDLTMLATWDHIVPVARGGTNWRDNKALACYPCNQRKGRQTAEEYREQLKSEERRD